MARKQPLFAPNPISSNLASKTYVPVNPKTSLSYANYLLWYATDDICRYLSFSKFFHFEILRKGIVTFSTKPLLITCLKVHVFVCIFHLCVKIWRKTWNFKFPPLGSFWLLRRLGAVLFLGREVVSWNEWSLVFLFSALSVLIPFIQNLITLCCSANATHAFYWPWRLQDQRDSSCTLLHRYLLQRICRKQRVGPYQGRCCLFKQAQRLRCRMASGYYAVLLLEWCQVQISRAFQQGNPGIRVQGCLASAGDAHFIVRDFED